MGRKRIHDSNSLKYKAYRLRKEQTGRFVRVFIPDDIDKELQLKGHPRRLVEIATQSEELKKQAIGTLFYLLEAAIDAVFVLQHHKEVDFHPSIKNILIVYFHQTWHWFWKCRNQFGISLREERAGLESRIRPLEKYTKNLRNKIDPKLYDDLVAEIQDMAAWLTEDN